jgi:hypothetical protein
MVAGAVAIVLLVNGLQIGLPQPAFVQDGSAWVPARAVLTAAGYEVRWEQEGNYILLLGADPPATIYLERSEVLIGELSERLTPPPRRVNGTFYLPATFFRLLAFEVQWEPEAKTLRLRKHAQKPRAVTISELIDEPLAYLGQRVQLACEYVELPGPGKRDCLVQDRKQTIRCILPASGPGASPGETIRGAIGVRINVIGRVKLSKFGSIYLDILELHQANGGAALSCVLNTDRARYRRDQTVLVEFAAYNQTRQAIKLGEPVTASLSIKDDSGGEVWRQGLVLPPSIVPGETELLSFRWESETDIKSGGYVLALESDMELWAHQVCFRIDEDVKRKDMPPR